MTTNKVEEKDLDLQASGMAARPKLSLKNLRNHFSIIMLIGLAAVFSLLAPQFATWTNGRVILEQSAVLIVVALGATFVIIAGSIDLSVGSVAGLSAVLTAMLISSHGVAAGVAMALAAGALIGLFNGLVFAIGKIPSFIVTLGALTAVRGIILGVTNGSPTVVKDSGFLSAVAGRHLGISNGVIIAVVLVILTYIALEKLAFGREIRAIGGGEKVARLSGIRVNRAKITAFILCSLLAAIGGILMVARNRVGDPTQGIGLELQVIAAVVIGGTPLTGGVGRIWGTVIGALTIGVLSNGLNILGVEPYWQEIITGIVLVAAVFLTIDRKKIGIIK